MANKQPKKPASVPKEAKWRPNEKVWALGTKNKKGKEIGEWNWWHPEGHLDCKTIYQDETEKNFTYTRFHPDGTPSREGTYKNGVEHGLTTYTRSHNPSEEYFAFYFNETNQHIWKAELTFDKGHVIAEKYFDKDGNQVEYYFRTSKPKNDEKTVKETVIEFNSIEEASNRWIKEGKTFKDAINEWLDVIYIDKKEQKKADPKETRKDMASYVLKQIIALNEKGEYQKLRALFPPDYDPFVKEYEKDFTQCVSKVMLLPDGRIIAHIGQFFEAEQQTYIIKDEHIVELPEVLSFGCSADKKYFAKAYSNRIEISEGWDGRIIASINYPKDYGVAFSEKHADIKISQEVFTGEAMNIESIHVFSDGRRILLNTHRGIFVVSEKEYQLLHPMVENFGEDEEEPWYLWPKNREEMDDGFAFYLDYPNADLSPDDAYISLGSQDSTHIILTEKNGKWDETGFIAPRSSYPNCTRFNYLIKDDFDNPYLQVALSSCHFSESSTIALPLKNLTEDFQASGFDADETLDYIDDANWVFSILPSRYGYFLGSNNGYIWLMRHAEIKTLSYLHIGGTIMSMDMSEDGKTFIIANNCGQIIVLKNEYDFDKQGKYTFDKNNRLDPFLITNLPFVDKKRYIFWKDCKPMIW